jgi:hypothetical protein
MAEQTPSLLKRYPWLLAVSGLAAILFAVYVVVQMSAFKRLSELHAVTLDQVAQSRPTSGTYSVSGGLLNYVLAQAVGFTNDPEKDAGGTYDSYVPCSDPKTKKVVMLVKIPGESPKTLLVHSDDPPENSIIGFFQDPDSVPPEIFQKLSNWKYEVPPGTPVMEMFGGADPAVLKRKIFLVGSLAVVIGGGPWLVMYLLTRPKKKRKSFSDRYPTRRVY